jgi:rRNA maturation endonuclease Nob1
MEILIAVLLYFMLPLSIVIIAVISFIIAYRNRKIYVCKECGEIYKVEQMEAKQCSVCGSTLIQIKAKEIKEIL